MSFLSKLNLESDWKKMFNFDSITMFGILLSQKKHTLSRMLFPRDMILPSFFHNRVKPSSLTNQIHPYYNYIRIFILTSLKNMVILLFLPLSQQDQPFEIQILEFVIPTQNLLQNCLFGLSHPHIPHIQNCSCHLLYLQRLKSIWKEEHFLLAIPFIERRHHKIMDTWNNDMLNIFWSSTHLCKFNTLNLKS